MYVELEDFYGIKTMVNLLQIKTAIEHEDPAETNKDRQKGILISMNGMPFDEADTESHGQIFFGMEYTELRVLLRSISLFNLTKSSDSYNVVRNALLENYLDIKLSNDIENETDDK